MYLTGKLENGRREKKKNKIGSYHIALLSFQLPPPPPPNVSKTPGVQLGCKSVLCNSNFFVSSHFKV